MTSWTVRLYDLTDEEEKRLAEAKIKSIERMRNRYRYGYNKSLNCLQVKTDLGDYLFDIVIQQETEIMMIKERTVFAD